MVNTAIASLKAGAIIDTLALNYVGNYCTKGWITDDGLLTAINRITAIAAGEPDPADIIDYNSMTVAELKELAKERGLSGYSTLSKAELIALLEADDSNATV
ncbi:Rho termination factor, N-terminal domain [Popillia japonica]|uniref:Rho termination factor, N-terminal domain n=1 Tax=Popillia japonica TaxID=7064 RepID=A0AAW1HV11_POPJA